MMRHKNIPCCRAFENRRCRDENISQHEGVSSFCDKEPGFVQYIHGGIEKYVEGDHSSQILVISECVKR